MKSNYKFHKEHSVLECETLSIEYAKIEEHQKMVEKFGIEEDKIIYPEVTKAVFNITELGGITYFNHTSVELFEEGNFTDATFVEFKSGFEIVVVISFEEFKEVYYDYLGIKN